MSQAVYNSWMHASSRTRGTFAVPGPQEATAGKISLAMRVTGAIRSSKCHTLLFESVSACIVTVVMHAAVLGEIDRFARPRPPSGVFALEIIVDARGDRRVWGKERARERDVACLVCKHTHLHRRLILDVDCYSSSVCPPPTVDLAESPLSLSLGSPVSRVSTHDPPSPHFHQHRQPDKLVNGQHCQARPLASPHSLAYSLITSLLDNAPLPLLVPS